MSEASPSPGPAKAKSWTKQVQVGLWSVVLVVGILIVALVLCFNLIPRLSAGQKVLNGAKPLFNAQRLDATAAGISYVGENVAMADPIMTSSGSGASEVVPLVSFVASKTHLTDKQVLLLLHKDFPNTTDLLLSLPLSTASAELTSFEGFLESSLHLSGAQLLSTLKTNFPSIYNVAVTLPQVTSGWNNVPGTSMLTRFDGSPVTTAPELSDYFNDDVVPALASQQGNFTSLNSTKIAWIPVFLLIVGFVVILLALVMIVHSARGPRRSVSRGAALLVPIVGVVAIILAVGWQLNSRVNHGQKLLDGLKPAFTQDRVQGARAGVNYVGTVYTLQDQIMTQSGAASEVPGLIAFVAKEEKLSEAQTAAVLEAKWPHLTALLGALPLSSVATEIPQLEAFLESALKVTPTQLDAALKANFPGLFQTLAYAPTVINNWESVPGTANLTRFDGKTAVHTGPQLAAYLSDDVIPVLETQRTNFAKLNTHGPITWIGIVVLIVGIVATEFGLLMFWAAGYIKDPEGSGPKPQKVTASA